MRLDRMMLNAIDRLIVADAPGWRSDRGSELKAPPIEQILADAERYKDSDVKRKELAELKNSAEALLYTSEKAVEECAELVSAEVLDAVRNDIAVLRELLEGEGDAIAIREALQQLELSAYRIAESMYG